MLGFVTPSPESLFHDHFTSLSLCDKPSTNANKVRNSVAHRAIADAANVTGELPQNWGAYPQGGIAVTPVAVGTTTVGGQTVGYVDLRIHGTATTDANTSFDYTYLTVEADHVMACAAGQTWTGSVYAALVAGGTTNVGTVSLRAEARDGSNAVAGNATADIKATVASSLARFSASFTTTTGAAFTKMYVYVGSSAAAAMDLTLRLTGWQMEQAASASALVPNVPDDGNWTTLPRWGSFGATGSAEQQYYVDYAQDGTRISGGNNPFGVSGSDLLITAAAAPGGSSLGKAYTSGCLTTQGRFTFSTGYVEARIKLPYAAGTSQGYWPAFWALQSTLKKDASYPEIDIMEWWGDDPTVMTGTVHTWDSGSWVYLRNEKTVSAVQADYHTYGVEVRSDRIVWYMDRVPYGSRTTPNDTKTYPFYLLIDLAVGGPSFGNLVDVGQVPASLAVDYVRVWDSLPF